MPGEGLLYGGGIIIWRVEGEGGEVGRHARAGLDTESGQARPGLGEETTRVTMVAALEFEDQVALGEAAGEAYGGHGGFRSGADEADALDLRDTIRTRFS